MAAEAAERARAKREGERRSQVPDEPCECRKRSFHCLELRGLERSEPIGEPGRPACADAAKSRSPSSRQPEADTPPVVFRADTLDEARTLEPVDMPGHRRGGDALLGGELGERKPGLRFTSQSKVAWRAVIPSCSVSFRSSRASRRSTGRSSAAVVSALSVTSLTINVTNDTRTDPGRGVSCRR